MGTGPVGETIIFMLLLATLAAVSAVTLCIASRCVLPLTNHREVVKMGGRKETSQCLANLPPGPMLGRPWQ